MAQSWSAMRLWFFSVLSISQALSWVELSPTGTSPGLVAEHTAVWSDAANGFYTFGGQMCCQRGSSADIHFYDKQANTWQKMSPSGDVPSGRHGHSMTWSPQEDGFYIFGGFAPNDGGFKDDLFFWSRQANSFTQLNYTGTAPSPRDDHSAIWGNDGLIVTGGFGGNWISDVYHWSRQANQWSQLTTGGPQARRGHKNVWVEAMNGFLGFGGSGWCDGNCHFNDLGFFSMQANAWVALTPTGDLPPARGNGVAFLHENTLYVVGGEGDGGYLNDIWTYTQEANQWTQLSPSGTLPAPRAKMIGVGFVDGGFFIQGGYDASNRDDMWWFQLETTTAAPTETAGSTDFLLSWTVLAVPAALSLAV